VTQTAHESHRPDSMDLREVLDVLRRHVGLVLAVVTIGMAGALVFVLRQKPEYRAQAVIGLRDERRAMTEGLESDAVQQALGTAEDPLLSQLQVLQSRGVAGSVVDRLGLRVRPLDDAFDRSLLEGITVQDPAATDTLRLGFGDDGYQLRQEGHVPVSAHYGEPVSTAKVTLTVTGPPGVGDCELAVIGRERAIDELLDHFRAVPRENTHVVDVAYTSTDPLLAQQVVNTMVDVFQALNARDAQEQSHRRRAFIEEQLTQTDQALAKAQQDLTRFREQKQVFDSEQRITAQQAGLMDLQARREELNADRSTLRALLGELSDADPDGTGLLTLVSAPGVAANPVIATLYDHLVQYETSLDSLTTGPWGRAKTDPDVRRLRTLVVSTRKTLLDAVTSQVAVLDARIAALDDLKARSEAEMAAMPATEAQEAQLAQRVETVGKVADQLREEYQRARIAEAVQAGQVYVIDAAPLPDEPVGSGRAWKLALALLLALVLGTGLAFLRESLNTAIRHRQDVVRDLRIPSLVVVPQFSPANGRRQLVRLGVPRLKGRSGRDHRGQPWLVAATDMHSPSAEAYRTLRTNLIFSQAVRTLHRVVVTSAAEGEGKTTTATNLAVAFAQQGMRVLLVDCDLRHPGLDAIFGLPREPGLTQLVLGHVQPADVVRNAPVDGLSIITSGTVPPNPGELLASERMEGVLGGLGGAFELVLMDTPPVLAASEVAALAARSDGVLLVLRAGQTERGAAVEALHRFRDVGARVVGAVLNDPDAKVPSYGAAYYPSG